MEHSHRTMRAVDCRNQKGGQIRIFQDEFPYAHVANVLAGGPHPASDARRIVAAVNACKGIPTEALEAGVVGDMLRALKVASAAIMCRTAPERPLYPVERKALDLADAALRKARGEEEI